MVSICGTDRPASRSASCSPTTASTPTGVINTPDRPGIAKVRLVGLAQHRHPQHLIRLDFEDPSPIDAALADRVVAALETALDGAAALCIEDYNKGLLTPRRLPAGHRACAKSQNIPVFVDPDMLSDYTQVRRRDRDHAQPPRGGEGDAAALRRRAVLSAAGGEVARRLELEAVVLTLDKDGAYLATRDGERRWLKTRERKVYDVAGAGDMLLSMLAMARCAGGDWVESVALANVAAGLEVEKYGSVPITPTEIMLELLTEAARAPRQAAARSSSSSPSSRATAPPASASSSPTAAST